MAGEFSEQVKEFKLLDNKRGEIGLDPEQEQRWLDLKEAIERVSDGDESPPSSRRGALRVKADLEIEFEDAHGFKKAYSRNISEGGVYVETERALEMGSRFQLKIVVKEPPQTLELAVEVVWVNRNPSPGSHLGQGVGVAFLDLPADKKMAIKAIVHHALDETLKVTGG